MSFRILSSCFCHVIVARAVWRAWRYVTWFIPRAYFFMWKLINFKLLYATKVLVCLYGLHAPTVQYGTGKPCDPGAAGLNSKQVHTDPVSDAILRTACIQPYYTAACQQLYWLVLSSPPVDSKWRELMGRRTTRKNTQRRARETVKRNKNKITVKLGYYTCVRKPVVQGG